MSTLAEDIADDYRDFDGLETVTLRQIRPGGANPVPITYTDDDDATQPAALRRQLSKRDLMVLGAAAIPGEATIWELPVSVVGSAGVENGDTITDSDGKIWKIRSCDKATLGTRWRCLCVKQER